MKLLVDQNLPPRLAVLLTEHGHGAVHVRDLGLAAAPDPEILDRAAEEERIIVSADTDFGALLAHRRASRPSVVLVRAIVDLPPDQLADLLAERLPALADDLDQGDREGAPRVSRWTRRPRVVLGCATNATPDADHGLSEGAPAA